MANIIRLLHRLAGGAGAGSPTTLAPSGAVSINFDTGGKPELWASNGAAWQQLNPDTAITTATSAQILTGTATGVYPDPLALAGARTTSSAGVADAGKYVVLDAAGKFDSSVLDATALTTSLAPNTTTVSAGAADVGKYVVLDATGKFDSSVLGVTALTTSLSTVTTSTSAGAADANKYVTLDASGKLDSSVLNIEAMEYKGGADATAAAPGTPGVGDTYVVTTGGTIAGSWTGIAGGTAGTGDMLIWNGTAWDQVVSNTDLSAYVPLAGTAGVTGAAMASGSVLTMNPATALDVVLDGAGGSISNSTINCGTF